MAATCVSVPLGPACANITGVRSGDLNRFTMTLTNKGIPVNLTGQTVTAQARTKALAPEHLDAVIDILDAVAGELAIRWPGNAVTTWLNGKATQNGVWDLQVDNGTDDPVTVVAGTFAAEQDVTR